MKTRETHLRATLRSVGCAILAGVALVPWFGPGTAVGGGETTDVAVEGTRLVVSLPDSDGEVVHIRYDANIFSSDYFQVFDSDGGIAPGEGCEAFSTPGYGVRCVDADITRIDFAGGDGNDSLLIAGGEDPDQEPEDNPVPTSVDSVMWGGAGQDFLAGGGGHDRIHGGPGADEEKGEMGPDTFRGRLPDAGRDTFLGGPGQDLIDARDQRRDEAINCGKGSDNAKRDQLLDPPAQNC